MSQDGQMPLFDGGAAETPRKGVRVTQEQVDAIRKSHPKGGIAKTDAENAIRSVLKGGQITWRDLMFRVQRYAVTLEERGIVKGTEKWEYEPRCATWMRSGRWRDDGMEPTPQEELDGHFRAWRDQQPGESAIHKLAFADARRCWLRIQSEHIHGLPQRLLELARELYLEHQTTSDEWARMRLVVEGEYHIEWAVKPRKAEG